MFYGMSKADLRRELKLEREAHEASVRRTVDATGRMKSAMNAEHASRLAYLNTHDELVAMTARAAKAEAAQARAEHMLELAIMDAAGIIDAAAKAVAEAEDRLAAAMSRREATNLTGGDVVKAKEVLDFWKGEAEPENDVKEADGPEDPESGICRGCDRYHSGTTWALIAQVFGPEKVDQDRIPGTAK